MHEILHWGCLADVISRANFFNRLTGIDSVTVKFSSSQLTWAVAVNTVLRHHAPVISHSTEQDIAQ